MDVMDWPVRLLLAFVLGAVIGLEREINEKKESTTKSNQKSAILGLRSFSLISGLGAICGVMYFQFPILSAIAATAVFILTIAYYILDTNHTHDVGMTTELAIIFAFAIGFLLVVGILPVQLIIALTVIVVLLMSRKENIKNFVEDISKNEINALVSFAILAFVILPFLPNESFAISDLGGTADFFKRLGVNFDLIANVELFNPFKLWLIVVLITGVDLLGYVCERTLGAKSGWLLTSVVGGFVSSTATTISIAQESKRILPSGEGKTTKAVSPLLAGAIFATIASFVPVIVLLLTLNAELFFAFLPILLGIVLTSIFIGSYFLYSSKNENANFDEKKITEGHKIFDLVSALKFVGIFLFINIFSKIGLLLFGGVGFLLTIGLGALTGIDAVVVNTAQLAGSSIDLNLGVWALVLANSINLLAKSVYSFIQGSREFAWNYLISMLGIIGISVIAAVIF